MPSAARRRPQQLVADVDAQYAARPRGHPEWAASTPSTPSPTPGRSTSSARTPRARPSSPRSASRSRRELDEITGDDYSKEISAEQLDLVGDLDLVVWCTDEGAIPDLQSDPVVSGLASVEQRATRSGRPTPRATSSCGRWTGTPCSAALRARARRPAGRGGAGGRESRCPRRLTGQTAHDATETMTPPILDRPGRRSRTPRRAPSGRRSFARPRPARAGRRGGAQPRGRRPEPRASDGLGRRCSTAASEAELIVRHLRVPRTIAGLLVGAALGLAGALMQALTRNPLADPGLLGVNAGAACAVVLRDRLPRRHPARPTTCGSRCLGAGVATVVVYLLGSTGRGGALRCASCWPGAAITAVLTGVISAVVLTNSIAFNGFRSWTVGSLQHVTPRRVQVLPFLAGRVRAGPVASVRPSTPSPSATTWPRRSAPRTVGSA